MTEAVLTAGITAAAAVVCQLIITSRSSSLIAYRVEQLEKKVDKLNSLTERICRVEEDTRRTAEHITRISDNIPHLHHPVQ